MKQSYAALRKQLVEAVTSVFGQMPTFISDSPSLVEWLKSIGCHTYEFKEVHNLSAEQRENVIAFATNEATIPPVQEWDTHFRDSRILMIPLLSFDASMEAAIYAVECLSRSTFEAAADANERWLKLLLEREDPMIFRGKGCDFVCEIEQDVYVMGPKTKGLLSSGEWMSIGSFFEVGMVPQPEDIRPAFIVNGTLSVPGVAVAHHRQMPDDLLQQTVQAWKLFQNLREQKLFPLQMSIENSRMMHVWAGEKDIAEELEYLTNKRRKLVLTEMAFSTNGGIVAEDIDWTKNSQMNEGAIGIHVAIGDGLTGAHIDFICPGVELKN